MSTSKPISFSADLIHRDSLEGSTSYIQDVNGTDSMARTISHSRSRLSYLKSKLKVPNNHAVETTNIQSTIMAGGLMYHMEIFVGTPPVKQIVGVDTGSDMIWIQCHPCEQCFRQLLPIFNPSMSSSYKALRSGSDECKELGDKRMDLEDNKICKYSIIYGDCTYSSGDLAKESYRVGRTNIPNIVQGCGNLNVGKYDVKSTGILGLGLDPLSFIFQTQDSTGGMFSYCLVSRFGSNPNARSRINFGNIMSSFNSYDVVSTPLHMVIGSSLYFLTLESISVGHMTIQMPRKIGNIVIDNGSTLNYLPSLVLANMKHALRQQIHKTPSNVPGQLCYEMNTDIPTITYNFANGASLALSKTNTFIIYENNKLCLAVLEDEVDEDNEKETSIFGIRAQMDFLIGYNIPDATIYFKPTDCSREGM
ncbi:aspartic proteinase CDR1-like [Impatiens glandulifera]|uniref:aspartic proteinase CDR1-like n=1 Tax=Impatiens glandulifera TaxID=253017 RepID=UPI001FB05547|nr:aspartic proteinase CDR1-like [Impatiens glandulifera]